MKIRISACYDLLHYHENIRFSIAGEKVGIGVKQKLIGEGEDQIVR